MSATVRAAPGSNFPRGYDLRFFYSKKRWLGICDVCSKRRMVREESFPVPDEQEDINQVACRGCAAKAYT